MPSLLDKKYWFGGRYGGIRLTPLSIFLKLEVGLPSIRYLVHLHPGILFLENQVDAENNTPLHLACQFCSTEILAFIVETMGKQQQQQRQRRRQQPDQDHDYLTKENNAGHQPVHCALLNTRHEIAPEVLATLVTTGCDLKLAWELALITNQPQPILNVLVDCTTTDLDLDTRDQEDTLVDDVVDTILPINLSRAKAIARLCERVPSLGLYHRQGWDCDAFLYLLVSLMDNHNLQKLELDHCTPGTIEPPSRVLQTLETLLERNATLTKLSFSLNNESDVTIWHSWVMALERGLANNKTLISVRFNNWYCDVRGRQKCCEVGWESTVAPIANNNTTITTITTNGKMSSSWMEVDGSEAPCGAKRQQEQQEPIRKLRLVMHGFQLSDPCFVERSRLLSLQAPPPATTTAGTTSTLDTLELDVPFRWTQPSSSMVEFLGRARTLTTLKIKGCPFDDALFIFEALKDHPNLQFFTCTYPNLPAIEQTMMSQENLDACLDLVEHYNLNLVECYPWSSNHPRIEQYLHLNRFGRKRMIKTTGTGQTKEFVEVLESVKDAKLWEQYSDSFEISIMYELLRHEPGLWCHCLS